MENEQSIVASCKICNSISKFLFKGVVLNKYDVRYYKCIECQFIQTEEPFWLTEAYSSPIGILDLGLLFRNQKLSNTLSAILTNISDINDSYLDYGGGYGVFVRMMRDKGYKFYLYDKYCENLFAKFFELNDFTGNKFFTVTAFEVFEHLIYPLDEIANMWQYSDLIIFSTELQPNTVIASEKDWSYFAPFGGQHIALYHLDTLKKISSIFNCRLYTNGINLHILSKFQMTDPFISPRRVSLIEKILNKFRIKVYKEVNQERSSLLMEDWEYYKTKLGVFN